MNAPRLALRGYDGMRRIDFGLALDSDGLHDRHQLLTKPLKRFLGLPHIHDPESVGALPCHMNEKPLDRPISRLPHARAAARKLPNGFFVCGLGESGRLKNRDNGHGNLLWVGGYYQLWTNAQAVSVFAGRQHINNADSKILFGSS